MNKLIGFKQRLNSVKQLTVINFQLSYITVSCVKPISRFIFKNGKEVGRMEEPKIAQKAHYAVDVEAGKTYYWCACGRSGSQPFCDGSHKVTSFTPLAFTAEKTETVHLCGCKHTKTPPFCDGTHHSL